ncbi:hypothetical protein [Aureimonas ureilytica]|uniref:hypothetical protein n=1 Tax=Aureimonas ureilytica TaxID=401562 RepID=UPI00037408C0|nr:hypothetical protein [Aureimonas ureilytica]
MLGHNALSETPISTATEAVLITLRGSAELWVAFRPGSATLRASSELRLNADTRIFAATEDYISRPSDAIPNRLFAGTMRQALRFNRAIRGGMAFDGFSMGLGEAILTNADGAYDGLARTHAMDGRSLIIRLGGAASAYDTFGVVFAGQSTGFLAKGEEFIVELRDNAYLLDVPASATTFAGTGGLEGGEDLKGRRRPRAFGYVQNVTPAALTQNTTLVHSVGTGAAKAIPAVYVRGAPLLKGPDFPTYEALVASTVEKGYFNTCLAQSLFRPAFTLSEDIGQYTADVEGEMLDGNLAASTPDIIELLARGAAGVLLDQASFARVRSLQSAPVGYYLPPGDETTISQAMTALMRGVGGWAGFRRNGRLEVGILQAPKGDPNAPRVTDIEIITIEPEALPDGIDPPPYRMRAAYALNWTVRTDSFAGSVSEERRTFLREAFRISTPVEDAAIRRNHPLAPDPEVLPSFFRDEADAVKECRRQLRLWRDARSLYRMSLRVAPFVTDLGREMHVTYPRWDLTEGRSLVVVEVDEDTENNIVEVLAYG